MRTTQVVGRGRGLRRSFVLRRECDVGKRTKSPASRAELGSVYWTGDEPSSTASLRAREFSSGLLDRCSSLGTLLSSRATCDPAKCPGMRVRPTTLLFVSLRLPIPIFPSSHSRSHASGAPALGLRRQQRFRARDASERDGSAALSRFSSRNPFFPPLSSPPATRAGARATFSSEPLERLSECNGQEPFLAPRSTSLSLLCRSHRVRLPATSRSTARLSLHAPFMSTAPFDYKPEAYNEKEGMEKEMGREDGHLRPVVADAFALRDGEEGEDFKTLGWFKAGLVITCEVRSALGWSCTRRRSC